MKDCCMMYVACALKGSSECLGVYITLHIGGSLSPQKNIQANRMPLGKIVSDY